MMSIANRSFAAGHSTHIQREKILAAITRREHSCIKQATMEYIYIYIFAFMYTNKFEKTDFCL